MVRRSSGAALAGARHRAPVERRPVDGPADRPAVRRSPGRQRGQALVEFSLVIPLFITIFLAVFEFAFLMNGQLTINYATRDAALIAAEAGNAGADGNGDDLADCVILQKVEQDVSAPAAGANISQVQVFWTNADGQPLSTTGSVTTFGSGTQAANIYSRTGSITCTFPDGTTIVVPYTQTKGTYPSANRCNAISGPTAGCVTGHPSIDTIGVQIIYSDTWKTPLHTLISLMGSGWTLTQSNQMRMEPVL
jgi:Flp pilus assembly protein TadG